MCDDHWSAEGGLVTLGADAIHLRDLLDAAFIGIAKSLGAEEMRFPSMLKVRDVDSLDYFRNFPQLPLTVSATDPIAISERRDSDGTLPWEGIDRKCLEDASHILPPAACYAVYIHHRGRAVGGLKTVTTVAGCFRNETHYAGLKRLKSFTMREIVFIGEMERVTDALNQSRERVLEMCDRLGITISLENATDPFFDPNSTRAVTQKLFPTKQELLCDDLAIASANFHRNFFGERFNITSAEDQVAYTACIGMGLERWIHSLLDATGNDVTQAIGRVRDYLGAWAGDLPSPFCFAQPAG